jgi:transposase InsO family protein/transposase
MASRKRALFEPTDDWRQLQFQLDWPEQHRYELIRPVVVFGAPPVERAQQTGVSARTIYRRVRRFDELGMQSLFEAEPVDDQRALPTALRQAIVQLKAEYPAFRPNELATICEVRFERRPSRTTIQKILATEPPPTEVVRRFPRYADMTAPLDRRGAIVRLHAEGWNIASIAGYLETSRPTIYATLKRWIEEGVRGRADKPSIPQQPATKTTLWAMNQVRKLQQNPELGAFRIHAALEQLGSHLSTRTCGRILARNRKLYGLRGPEAKPREPKAMPFKADRRHQYWTVDVRYLDHQLGDGNIYSITILDNYSRFIVGSAISRTQDQPAFLQVLLSAVTEYGAPEAIVSDGGSIFSTRRVDQQGYVRVRNWRLYGERGLADRPASVWVTEEEVTIQFAEEPLARYGVTYQRDHRHFRQVVLKRIFETSYQSLQPPLLELNSDDWRLMIELPRRRRRRRRHSSLIQAVLFAPDEAIVNC